VSLASEPPRRRTQQERRDGTQRVLLRATVDCLVELGYHGTTTLEVEHRAGVSRGARIHHFASKAALLAAAIDHLYDELHGNYEQAFGALPAGATDRERFRAGLRILWELYRRPDYVAALELQMAARTDAELRAHLQEVAERHRLLAVATASRHFPRLDAEGARAIVEVLHVTLVGLLMQRGMACQAQGEHVAETVLSALDDVMTARLRGRVFSPETRTARARVHGKE
jgi:AcrR family transcriptional regulator